MSLCEPDGTYWGADGRARAHRRVNRSHTSPPKRHWTARDSLPGGVSRGGLANADGRTHPARDQTRPCSAYRARTSTLQCAAVRREGGAVRDGTVIARRATTGNDQTGRAAGATFDAAVQVAAVLMLLEDGDGLSGAIGGRLTQPTFALRPRPHGSHRRHAGAETASG